MVAKDYTDPVYQFRPAHLLRLLPLLFGFYLFDQLVHNRFDVVDTGDEFEFRQRWLFGRTMSLPKAKVRGVCPSGRRVKSDPSGARLGSWTAGVDRFSVSLDECWARIEGSEFR